MMYIVYTCILYNFVWYARMYVVYIPHTLGRTECTLYVVYRQCLYTTYTRAYQTKLPKLFSLLDIRLLLLIYFLYLQLHLSKYLGRNSSIIVREIYGHNLI